MKEKIIYKKVDELKLNDRNPRKNDGAVETIIKSINEFGFRNPLIIDADNKVWCGNTRLKAARKIGLLEVPCIVAEDLTEEQIRKLALLDNKTSEIAEWDYDLLSEELADLDLSEFELDWNLPNSDIDWASVDDLSDKKYEEPEHNMLECPLCHHIDRDIHFRKVKGADGEEIKTE